MVVCVIFAKLHLRDTYCSRNYRVQVFISLCLFVCPCVCLRVRPSVRLSVDRRARYSHKTSGCVVKIKMKVEFENGSGLSLCHTVMITQAKEVMFSLKRVHRVLLVAVTIRWMGLGGLSI